MPLVYKSLSWIQEVKAGGLCCHRVLYHLNTLLQQNNKRQ